MSGTTVPQTFLPLDRRAEVCTWILSMDNALNGSAAKICFNNSHLYKLANTWLRIKELHT